MVRETRRSVGLTCDTSMKFAPRKIFTRVIRLPARWSRGPRSPSRLTCDYLDENYHRKNFYRDEKETGNKELREVYEKTCISFHDNRYFATLPWKEEHPPLPMNKEIAHRRTENVYKRLKKEPHLLQKYGEIIGEQERRGFIEKIGEDTVTSNTVHYIPASCRQKRIVDYTY
ncbi:Hypothetical predicted protein [Mytilus galloprovincialis]|uniref:Uncharacterized protein n=1 Tax=Mytilus galloprovincialis TaxID=29158 RepID=A0A8B6CIG1_MYTGA|nr:Hypothetical predicted protein [Mytilus galloprovincialis]